MMVSPVMLTPKIAILQRVLSASVTVDQQVVSSIGTGIVVFAAMAPGDTEKEADSMASKILKLKLWDDESGGRVWYQVSSIANPRANVDASLCASGRKVSKTLAARCFAVTGSRLPGTALHVLTAAHSISIYSPRLHQKGKQT